MRRRTADFLQGRIYSHHFHSQLLTLYSPPSCPSRERRKGKEDGKWPYLQGPGVSAGENPSTLQARHESHETTKNEYKMSSMNHAKVSNHCSHEYIPRPDFAMKLVFTRNGADNAHPENQCSANPMAYLLDTTRKNAAWYTYNQPANCASCHPMQPTIIDSRNLNQSRRATTFVMSGNGQGVRSPPFNPLALELPRSLQPRSPPPAFTLVATVTKTPAPVLQQLASQAPIPASATPRASTRVLLLR
jgi:hypothetical protein